MPEEMARSNATRDIGGPGDRRLSRRSYALYASGSVGTGGFSTLPGLLLLVFLTDEVGVSAAVAGLVVLVPKLWDVLLNPMVGAWSDRTKSRWGPRAPWMVAGAVVLPVFFVAMFAVPQSLTGGGAALYVMVMFLLAATGYAFFQVPYTTLPAEITDSYLERTTMTAVRIVVLALAILLFGAGAPLLVEVFGGGLTGYLGMAIIAAALLAVGFLTSAVGLRRVPTVVRGESEGSVREQLSAVRESRDFRVLFSAFTLQTLAAGTMLAAMPYLAEHLLGRKSAITLLFVALVGPAVLVMPLWKRIANRAGKRTGYILASLVFLTGSLTLTLAQWLPAGLVYLAVGVCGVGYAGMQMFPLAMLPDTIQEDMQATGRRRAGTFTGVWTAGETLGLAVGPALYSLVLAAGGYVSTTAGQTVVQPESALLAIGLGSGLLPSLLLIASVPFLRRYRLTATHLHGMKHTVASPHS
ncbi:MFS transporter [Streptomyces vietnamensis]|uniref:MFS transporter n=1 Tax=Streptomyces vietnamensis TaxID=362257 RepID=UPI0034152440